MFSYTHLLLVWFRLFLSIYRLELTKWRETLPYLGLSPGSVTSDIWRHECICGESMDSSGIFTTTFKYIVIYFISYYRLWLLLPVGHVAFVRLLNLWTLLYSFFVCFDWLLIITSLFHYPWVAGLWLFRGCWGTDGGGETVEPKQVINNFPQCKIWRRRIHLRPLFRMK